MLKYIALCLKSCKANILEINFSFVRLAVFTFGILLLEFTWGEKGSPVVQKANTENKVVRIQAEKFGFLFVPRILRGYKHATCIKHAPTFILIRNMYHSIIKCLML